MLTVGILISVTVTALESLSVAVAMPAAAAEVGGLSLYAWAFSAFFLAMTIGLALGGRSSDRFGPFIPFLVGALLFSLGLIIAGFAGSMPLIVLARAIQGTGAGLSNVATYAILATYPAEKRPHVFALVSSAWAIPGLLGPSWAGLITQTFGWRWVFWSLAPFPFLSILVVWLALRTRLKSAEPVEQKTTSNIKPKTLLSYSLPLSLGLAGLSISSTLLSHGQWIYSILAFICVAVCVYSIRGILAVRPGAFVFIFALTIALNLSFFGVDAMLPLFLVIARGDLKSIISGAALTAAALAWISASWVQSRIVQRTGAIKLVLSGMILVVIGTLNVALSMHPTMPVYLSVIGWAIAGSGMGFASNTLTLLSIENATESSKGEDISVMQLASVLGMSIGTGIGGIFLGPAKSFGDVPTQTLMSLCALLAFILALALPLIGRLRIKIQS